MFTKYILFYSMYHIPGEKGDVRSSLDHIDG